ncbi:hypothetical protein GY45DRAFT_1323684, partial [Cubamyces sp. BRFM 1775]
MRCFIFCAPTSAAAPAREQSSIGAVHASVLLSSRWLPSHSNSACALGTVYFKEFESNTDFLASLITQMRRERPQERPTAEHDYQEWQKIRATLSDSLFRWRLVPKSEQGIERVVNDTVAVAWEGIYHLKKLV